MIFAPELTLDQAEGALAEQDVPRDVDPLDPDDEVRYINYDNWRDFEDSCLIEDTEFEDHMTEYYNCVVDQTSNW